MTYIRNGMMRKTWREREGKGKGGLMTTTTIVTHSSGGGRQQEEEVEEGATSPLCIC